MFNSTRHSFQNDDPEVRSRERSRQRYITTCRWCIQWAVFIALMITWYSYYTGSPIYKNLKPINIPSSELSAGGEFMEALTVTAASKDTSVLHLLIPASKRDVNLCKSILSSTILGYPIPVLLNWGGSNSNIAMISGTLKYLKTLDTQNDEDLVMVVDGYDVWYQLSPQIMIDRYHEINRRANERIRVTLSAKAIEVEGINQTIVISSQKNCWPGGANDVNCYAVPESTLPRYIYGPQTDTNVKPNHNSSWELYPQQKTRQRWLNGGFVMGPVKEMRLLFERANERALADPTQYGLDQGVLARIFGEQEYQREKLRMRHGGPWRRSITPPASRKMFEAEEGVNYEFGIGLDYSSELSQATKYCERDLEWVVFDNRSSIDAAISMHNITAPHVASLQADVANAPLPFTSLTAPVDDNTNTARLPPPSPSTPWSSLPLWTNLYTGTTPAIVHHNAHAGNLKARRQTDWHRMWFQPYARDLLRARLRWSGDGVVAVDKKGKRWVDGMGIGMGERGFGVRTDAVRDGKGEGRWVGWGDVCWGEGEEEVWRDGRGAWVDVVV